MTFLLCKDCAKKLDVYKEWYEEEVTIFAELHCDYCGSKASEGNQMSDVSEGLIDAKAVLKRSW